MRVDVVRIPMVASSSHLGYRLYHVAYVQQLQPSNAACIVAARAGSQHVARTEAYDTRCRTCPRMPVALQEDRVQGDPQVAVAQTVILPELAGIVGPFSSAAVFPADCAGYPPRSAACRMA